MHYKFVLPVSCLFLFCIKSHAVPDNVAVAVWANEAIVTTYTYNFKTYLDDQKRMAQYFTTDGWIAYVKALNASKLPDAVQKNSYDVSAVATKPPFINALDPSHWIVSMPILVEYRNPQYQQQQNLKVVINIVASPSGQGTRGLAITSLQSTQISPPCQCAPTDNEGTAATKNNTQP